MGHGNYSHAAHSALLADRASQSGGEVFTQQRCHPLMSPHGLKLRESRDSTDHPKSLPVVFALDVTGSMGDIPRSLASQELPTFMKLLGDCSIQDAQLMFMAIGDATSDNAPVQVGQFESTAELMDQWLTWSYLEGGGGGTGSESYELAFYTLAQHTDSDSWGKRKKRGYLFMTGDELPYPAVSHHQVEAIFGEKLDEDVPIEEVIAAASEMYHLFFLIPDLSRRANCEKRWRQLLGDNVICMESPDDACAVAAAIVAVTEGVLPDLGAVSRTLGGAGVPADRTSAVLRCIEPYLVSLDPNAPRVHASKAGSASRPSWWKRIFD